MNFSELQREVKALVMDQSSNILITIPDAINEAVQQISEDVVLPSLKVLFTVTTSTSVFYVNFPSGFSGRLRYIGDTEGAMSLLDGGLEQLVTKHPDVTVVGDIEDLAQEGNVLYYLPIPSTAKALTCIGYNYPATLVNDTDTPTDIPEMVHRETICFKAASILYSYIEDGLEQEKINTTMFTNLAKVGMAKLSAWAHRRRSNVGTSVWSQ
jgi:hypothetical protein